MSKQFVPLTAEQLASAENGDLKLEYRNGCKVMQLVWLKEPYKQERYPILTVSSDGECRTHDVYGGDRGMNHDFDLFVCEEQPAKYGGQLTGVPVEIVEFMLDQQEAQGNKRDASEFEECFSCNKKLGGFDWVDTECFNSLLTAEIGIYEPMLEYLKTKKQ